MVQPIAVERVREELIGIRRGHALAHPRRVLDLSPQLRGHLLATELYPGDVAGEVTALVCVLRAAIESLSTYDRSLLDADFNLARTHSAATLTDRRHSLAAARNVSFRTITRAADKALDTLVIALIATHQERHPAVNHELAAADANHGDEWRRCLTRFWGLRSGTQVDIVCSEIPDAERPAFADLRNRNYQRYAKFADLDSLVHLRAGLAGIDSDVAVRDHIASEYHAPQDSHTNRVLLVVGGPPWNTICRRFERDLAYEFQAHPESDGRSLHLPMFDATLRPRWTPEHELVEDLAVVSKLTLARGLQVFFLSGCYSFGTFVAAQCFLHRELGVRNAQYIRNYAGDDDFTIVTETRRFGGDFTDVPDFSAVDPLLLMSRRNAKSPYTVLVDNRRRYSE